MRNIWKNNKKVIIIIASIIVLVALGTAVYSMFSSNNGDVATWEQEEIQALDDFELLDDDMIAEQFEIPEEENIEEENTTKKEKTNKKDENTTGGNAYYIKVNKSANVVTVYSKDGDGNYTVPVKAMVCSTGAYTPSCGKYPKTSYKTTGGKRRWAYLQGNVYGQYATQIVGNILFHSVPYLSQEPSSLEYWEYDKLGTSASAGCIRLTVVDAQWIYSNISGGTIVEFCSDSNPGPLGKPSAQKISGNEQCRGWDPTDWIDGNPWRNSSPAPKKEEAQKPSPTPKPTVDIVNNNTNTETENTKKTESEKEDNKKDNEDLDDNKEGSDIIKTDEKEETEEELKDETAHKESNKE